ncbi:hypothetical protein [Mycobacterium sp. ACS4331]|nr:hypothetical protein [Mycobacterium sp. ACS4331]
MVTDCKAGMGRMGDRLSFTGNSPPALPRGAPPSGDGAVASR